MKKRFSRLEFLSIGQSPLIDNLRVSTFWSKIIKKSTWNMILKKYSKSSSVGEHKHGLMTTFESLAIKILNSDRLIKLVDR